MAAALSGSFPVAHFRAGENPVACRVLRPGERPGEPDHRAPAFAGATAQRKRRAWLGLLALGLAVAGADAGRVSAANGSGQHDLVSYQEPAGWQKESGKGYVKFTRIDGSSWGQIAVYSSEPTHGQPQADFEDEWKTLVAGPFGLARPAERSPAQSADGWTVASAGGIWQFNGANVSSLLTTYSGHGVRFSILCNATAQDYLRACQRFVASAVVAVPALSGHSSTGAPAAAATGTPGASPVLTRLTSLAWTSRQNRRHASGMGDHAGRSRNTYRFDRDGSYRFDNETFQYHTPKYYLVREQGRYTVEGDVLTLHPASSVWSSHAAKPTDAALQSGGTGHPVVRYRVQFTTLYDRERLLLWPLDGRENPRDGTFNYHDGDVQNAYLLDAGE